VTYAVPDYVAREAGGWIPDDRGRAHAARGWRRLQWNFLPGAGVNAPGAWLHMFQDADPGGGGVTVAILDTGVAYRNWHQFRRSPDFAGTHFRAPCDLIAGTIVQPNGHVASTPQISAHSRCTDPFALDRQGHGTFVAGVVGEATNNRVGLTGIAYGATIMPVRVLDAQGNGDSITIARGIRWAATHGAKIINLSLEFDPNVTASDIPQVIGAIAFAHARGAMVIAAAGNDSATQLVQMTYPARDPLVVSVGATTSDRCLAAYSDIGPGLDLVAPGGGDDAAISGDTNCHPDRQLPNVFQMTFADPAHPGIFSLPDGWYGTSMAAPHVAAAAALVITSGVLGANPTPDQILQRLELTAQPLGPSPRPSLDYGYGLVNIGAATAGVSKTARYRHRRRHTKRHRKH
jgi:serine protease